MDLENLKLEIEDVQELTNCSFEQAKHAVENGVYINKINKVRFYDESGELFANELPEIEGHDWEPGFQDGNGGRLFYLVTHEEWEEEHNY